MLRTLAALIILAASARSLPGVSTYCDNIAITVDGYYCASCLQPVYCRAGATTEQTQCTPGYVCEAYPNNVAGCVAIASATQCDCSSNICDPFNSDYAVVCGATGVTDIEDCLLQGIPCTVGSCVTCDNFLDGWRPIPPACTAGYACDTNEVIIDSWQCPDGQYLNENGICAPSPPTPCENSCAGNCPDLTECTRYYVCDGLGGVVGDVQTCTSGLYFNPDAIPPACQIDPVLCSPWTACNFESPTPSTVTGGTTSTTTTTSTTSTPCTVDTVGNYPYDLCSSSYLSCRNTSGDIYEYVVMECPSGLIFNTDPDYPYCDDAANVATCT